ncbi:MAG: hypothetical protein WKF78_02800 [Candidatus Limnocylindrales bacterium]
MDARLTWNSDAPWSSKNTGVTEGSVEMTATSLPSTSANEMSTAAAADIAEMPRKQLCQVQRVPVKVRQRLYVRVKAKDHTIVGHA